MQKWQIFKTFVQLFTAMRKIEIKNFSVSSSSNLMIIMQMMTDSITSGFIYF